jgi:hypothetical protein
MMGTWLAGYLADNLIDTGVDGDERWRRVHCRLRYL